MRVPDLTSFVDLLEGETDVGGRRDLAPFLRRVVFVGEAAFYRPSIRVLIELGS
jgi:hypothetical protein